MIHHYFFFFKKYGIMYKMCAWLVISVKRAFKFIAIVSTFIFFFALSLNANAASYMSDKTEVPINLEVSGAEGLCQTDDGYVWIGQFSGLTRYDSREFVTYKIFEENGVSHDIINVKSLATKDNVLYIQTATDIFVYKDNTFHYVNYGFEHINNIDLYKEKDLLFVSTTKGLVVYDTKNDSIRNDNIAKDENVADCAIDVRRNTYYYQTDDGIHNEAGEVIYPTPATTSILDLCAYKDILLIGQKDGRIIQYNMETKAILEQQYNIGNQINKILYSEKDNVIFVGCEKNGICCIDEALGTYTYASNLENNSQIVDLMIDYEGNLWVSSHNISASGVSIITKNALTNLLYDDPIWQELSHDNNDRNVYAVERINDILYICSVSGLYLYDVNQKKIIDNSHIVTIVNNYVAEHEIKIFDYRDIEKFNNKIYIAVYNVGLLEYDTTNNNIVLYDSTYISNHTPGGLDDSVKSLVGSVRSLRAFDNYLAIGYVRGIMKFDGENFLIYKTTSNVLYINKSNDGKLIFDMSSGLFTINDDFTETTEIPTRKDVSGNRLKFLVDGDYIYYTLNSRLFRLDTKTNESKEVIIPYVKGSLVELAKILVTDIAGVKKYKYVVASQTQIYITDSLLEDQITNYEFYDGTNGLEPIIANSSGYYDETEQKYFFQTTNGIFVYDFNKSTSDTIPVKISIQNVELDGVKSYGNNIQVDKDVYRVAFNLSILGFKPNKGYSVYYKLDGVDNDYVQIDDSTLTINYTNLGGGKYTFHAYSVDEYGNRSNEVSVSFEKEKQVYETVWFWVLISMVTLVIILAANFALIVNRDDKAKKRENELKGITIESIEAIARTIDAKDTYTNGHSIRVGHYSRIIAKELGMEGDELENLYYTALLHDIGKIGIPDAILNKPGRLTDEEFVIMKSHTTKGAKILKDISTIPNIVEGAKYHHEKYGGGGYPEGLKGEEIPYVARIICCADCFDAMATRRVYKDPYPKEKIISEFERCKETQFDPQMADVVIRLIEEGKLKAE